MCKVQADFLWLSFSGGSVHPVYPWALAHKLSLKSITLYLLESPKQVGWLIKYFKYLLKGGDFEAWELNLTKIVLKTAA